MMPKCNCERCRTPAFVLRWARRNAHIMVFERPMAGGQIVAVIVATTGLY